VLVVVPLVLAAIAWIVIGRLHPEFWRNLMGAPFQADLYLVGLVLLMVAGNLAFLIFLRRKVSLPNLTLGATILWFSLATLTSFALPGMSYLFTWPALITTLVLGVMILQSGVNPLEHPAGITPVQWVTRIVGGAANILVVVPIITLLYMLIGFWFLMMTPSTPFILVPLLFVALLLAAIVPLIDLLVHNQKWIAPGFVGLLAVALLGIASLNSGFNPEQPMQNGVWYTLDADTKEATWYSFGEKPADAWTAQFFRGATQQVDPASLYPMFSDNPVPPAAFKGEAPRSNLPAPELTLLSDQTSGGIRTIKLQLSSPRMARGLLVKVSGSPVLAASVNDNRQTNPAWSELEDWYLRFYGMTDEGINFQLEVTPGSQITLTVTDQSDGLPELPGVTYSPRSAAMMPFALAQEYMPYPDTTSVRKVYQLP
jgi:hypothetical protein